MAANELEEKVRATLLSPDSLNSTIEDILSLIESEKVKARIEELERLIPDERADMRCVPREYTLSRLEELKKRNTDD